MQLIPGAFRCRRSPRPLPALRSCVAQRAGARYCRGRQPQACLRDRIRGQRWQNAWSFSASPGRPSDSLSPSRRIGQLSCADWWSQLAAASSPTTGCSGNTTDSELAGPPGRVTSDLCRAGPQARRIPLSRRPASSPALPSFRAERRIGERVASGPRSCRPPIVPVSAPASDRPGLHNYA